MRLLPSIHLLLLASVALLSSCISPASDRLLVNRIVVANYAEPKVDRFKIGFTAFGNKMSPEETLPGLAPKLEASVKQHARSRFKDVVYLENPPALPPARMVIMDQSELYGAFAKKLAAQHQADAVMLVIPGKGFPYGVPNYMAAKGFGVYHTSKSATVGAYFTTLVLNAKTGYRYGLNGWPAQDLLLPQPWKEKLSDYTAEEQQQLSNVLMQAFEAKMSRTLDAQGFKPRPQ